MKRYAFSGLKSGVHEGGGPCQKEDGPFLRQTKNPRAFPAIRKKCSLLLRPASCAAMKLLAVWGVEMVSCLTLTW